MKLWRFFKRCIRKTSTASTSSATEVSKLPKLGEPVESKLGEPVENKLGEPVENKLGEPVENKLGEPVENKLGEPVEPSEDNLRSIRL